MTKHLWDRLVDAKSRLEPVQLDLRVVFEHKEETAKVLVADPNFVAAARHGGIVPLLEAYIADQEAQDKWVRDGNDPSKFSWSKVGGALHPYAKTAGPMSDMEIMEYLVVKDTPKEVWRNDARRNMPSYVITNIKYVPANRMYRNAWGFSPDPEDPIVVDFEAARALQRKKSIDWFISADKRKKEIEPYIRFDSNLEQEFATLSAVSPDLVFDRLARSKTLSDLDRAIPGPLRVQMLGG